MTTIVRQQQRSDSAADWATVNPTLLAGEFGYDEDADRLKIGDGSTAWSSLPFLGAEQELEGVQATVTASGALVVGYHNPVNATSGAKTMTLADAAGPGRVVAVSKEDSSGNAVTVNVNKLRGSSAGTVVLRSKFDVVLFQSKSDGSWWPVNNVSGDLTLRANDPAFNTGAANADAYLTALYTATAALGAVLECSGSYLIGSGLALVTGTKVDARRATFVRNFDDTTSGTNGNSLVNSGGIAHAKVNNVTWLGGTFTQAVSTHRGSVFAIYGDDLTIRDVLCTGWYKGRFMQIIGDRITIDGCKAFGDFSVGTGGIRVYGGVDGKVSNCHVECGDDTYQPVPYGEGSNDTWLATDTERWDFINCTGYSAKARFISIGMRRNWAAGGANPAPGETEMTCSIRHVRFLGCVGRGGSGNDWHIVNNNGLGEINDIQLLGCQIETATEQGTPTGCEIARGDQTFVTNGGTLGRVRNITVEGWSVTRVPRKTSMRVYGQVEDLTLRGFDFAAPYYFPGFTMTATAGSDTVTFNNPIPASALGSSLRKVSNNQNILTGTIILTIAVDGLSATIADASDHSAASLPVLAAVAGYVGALNSVEIDGAARVNFERCIFRGNAGGDCVILGATSTPSGLPAGADYTVYDAKFTRCNFLDIANGMFGVSARKVVGMTFDGCTFVPASGATTPGGVGLATGASQTTSRVVLGAGNDFSQLPDATKRVVIGGSGTATGTVVTNGNIGVNSNAVGSVQFTYAATDGTPVNNSTVLVTSATLVATLEPNAVYEFEATIPYDADTAADFKIDWAVPAGATGFWENDGPGIAQTAAPSTTQIKRAITAIGTADAAGGGGVGTILETKPSGYVVTGATGGTFAFKYAQNTAHASDATPRAGRRLKVTRVA